MEARRLMKFALVLAIVSALLISTWLYSNQPSPNIIINEQEQQINPIAVVNTTMGEFKIELYEKEFKKDKEYGSIRLIENFKRYAASGFYDGLIIHGVSPWPYNKTKTLIWTGEYYPNLTKKEQTYPPIKYGKRTDVLFGLKHTDLAVSWFDTWNITSSFYICNGDWSNSGDPTTAWREPGLDIHDPVFGKVIDGVEVIRKIGELPHHSEVARTGDDALGYVPNTTVIINHITIYYPDTSQEFSVISEREIHTSEMRLFIPYFLFSLL